jgi:N-acyl-D-amino-acid deacylase
MRSVKKHGVVRRAGATNNFQTHSPTMRRLRLRLVAPAAVLTLTACATTPPPLAGPETYDVLITGGTVIDGTGAPGYRGDLAISGDRIAILSRSPLARVRARRVIDATNRVVAPGFIDLHAHLEPLPQLPDAESALRQGVTTAVGGPDGSGPWPLSQYLAERERQRIGINVAFLVGHNTIRRAVTGMAKRDPTASELERMREMVARGMGEGAWGLSTGLKYLPGAWSKTDEVIALARVAADSGGIYTSHLREEGLGLLESVAEAIEIGRQARIPVVLTHHKAVGTPMWGKSVATLAMVDSARRGGGNREAPVDVMIDQYPYTATHTGIGVLIPEWAFDGGDTAFARRTRDPVLRDSIKKGIVFNILNDRGGGDLRRVQFSRVSWQRELEGKTLYDWTVMRGLSATPQTGADLVIEAELKGGANAIYHVLDEGDVRRIMRHAQTMIASDGRLSRPGDGHPHPRAYGTFPRVLGRYVREERVLSLEQAVHKMTAMPAARLGLRDRGALRTGAYADVVVFDPARVADRATFDAPHQYPIGIAFVLVNGVVAVDGERFTGARNGRVLRRSSPTDRSR